MAKEINDQNFEATVLQNELPVIIDFWAEWCGPCLILGPTVEELAKEYEGKALIGKLNVDDNPEVSMQYGIRSIPTLLFFQNGKVVDKVVGVVTKTALAQRLEKLLSVDAA